MSSSSKVNLLQMQKYFEEQVGRIRVISDLRLSENEYRSLGAKLKSLSFFAGSENDMENYMLSVIVYSTYSLIYGETGRSFEYIIWQVLNNNQYMERMYLRMYKDAFYTYGIRTFDIRDKDFLTRCQHMTARHAGVPDCDKSAYFDLLSNYLDYTELDTFYNKLYDELPERTRYIFGLMEEDGRRQVLLDTRSLVNQVMKGELSFDELITKHPDMEFNLIEDCILWNSNKKTAMRQVF